MKQGVGRLARMADPGDEDALRILNPSRLGKAKKLKQLALARTHLWNELPAITVALIEGAKAGSVTHLKLLMELGVLEKDVLQGKATARREKSVGEVLLQRFRLDQQERAEAERKRKDADG